MPHRRTPLAALAVLCCIAAIPRPGRAYCRTTTGSSQSNPLVCPTDGMVIAWPSSCASLSIDPRLLPDGITRDQFRSAVDAASARWANAACSDGATPDFHFVSYADCPHRAEWNPRSRNANTVSFRPDWPDDAIHPRLGIAITITTFTIDRGEILDADTELNLQSAANPDGFVFTTGAPTATSVDLATVLTHEQGHAQGLAHSADRTAVMWYTAGLGEQRTTLTADDIAGICEIYPSSRHAPCNPDPVGGFECASCQCAAAGMPAPRATGWVASAVLLALIAHARRRGRG